MGHLFLGMHILHIKLL